MLFTLQLITLTLRRLRGAVSAPSAHPVGGPFCASFLSGFLDLRVDGQPVVIDNGTSSIKVGIATEQAPSAVFASMVGKAKKQKVIIGTEVKNDTYIGDAAQQHRGACPLLSPLPLVYPIARLSVSKDTACVLPPGRYTGAGHQRVQGLSFVIDLPVVDDYTHGNIAMFGHHDARRTVLGIVLFLVLLNKAYVESLLYVSLSDVLCGVANCQIGG